jgi:hypothetical protein
MLGALNWHDRNRENGMDFHESNAKFYKNFRVCLNIELKGGIHWKLNKLLNLKTAWIVVIAHLWFIILLAMDVGQESIHIIRLPWTIELQQMEITGLVKESQYYRNIYIAVQKLKTIMSQILSYN